MLAFRPKRKRHEELAKQLRAGCGSDPERAGVVIPLRSKEFDLIASPCEMKTHFARDQQDLPRARQGDVFETYAVFDQLDEFDHD